MSMHLEGPWLSMQGKKKGKRKFRNAEEARRQRELEELWKENQQRWASMSPKFSKGNKTMTTMKSPIVSGPVIDPERDSRRYPSLDTGSGSTAKAEPKVYTGDKMVGIGTMHKSNMVPIFSDQEAKDISTMRRN